MTTEDIEHLAIAIAKALQAARSVSDSEHYDHHRWITAKIEREHAWRRFWDQLSEHVAKWGAISLISAAGYAFYLGLKALVLRAA